jgi:hypothetical protein
MFNKLRFYTGSVIKDVRRTCFILNRIGFLPKKTWKVGNRRPVSVVVHLGGNTLITRWEHPVNSGVGLRNIQSTQWEHPVNSGVGLRNIQSTRWEHPEGIGEGFRNPAAPP